MNYYAFNGVIISSEVELSILPTSNEQNATVLIHCGDVPKTIDNPIKQTAIYTISQHRILIKLPNIGAFLIENGTHITIELHSKCQGSDLCTFILGPVWAALSYQQGKSLLKGALLSVGNQNWLISGLSPVGISTFALGMNTHCNVRVLSDEFCSYQSNGQEILINTGTPSLKVWQQSLEHFGINSQLLRKVRTGLEKFWLPLDEPANKSLTLHGIITLKEWRSDEASPVGIKQLSGFKALKKTYQYSFHRAYMLNQITPEQRFQQDLHLIQRCKVASLTFKRDFSYLQESCQRLYKWITQ